MTKPKPWWRDPEPTAKPLATIERKIVNYLGANALLRLWLEDRELAEKTPHAGPWLPRSVPVGHMPPDLMSITAAAEQVGAHRVVLNCAVSAKAVASYRTAPHRQARVSLAEVRAWNDARPKRSSVKRAKQRGDDDLCIAS